MDTITHGIVGALIGKAFFADDVAPNAPSWREAPRTAGRVAILSATLGAMFPDIDVFAGPLAHNSLAMITWHRSITHSLVMLPVWAVLLALLTGASARFWRWPAPPLTTLILIYAVALASHIFLDLITNFGTMIWSPLDYTRPAWDWLFIIDLLLTSAALVPQLAAWAYRRPERALYRAVALWVLLTGTAWAIGPLVRAAGVPYSTDAVLIMGLFFALFLVMPLRRGAGLRMGRVKWCRIGIALVALYLAFAGGMHQMALTKVKEFAADSHIDATTIAALPQPPSAARWVGMLATATGLYLVQFDVLGNEPVKIQFFPDPASNRYIADARTLPDVQKFLWFARFPVFRYLELGNERVVEISDLRFFGPGRPIVQRNGLPPAFGFTFQVVFDADGHVVSDGMLQPR
jgi:membrane-bound metal-dependent hydrolase YbcI (DUF457 family)